MGFGNKPKAQSNTAADASLKFQQDQATEARARETARQADIQTGLGKIDQNFAGFTPDYYNTQKTNYTNYYAPQLNDQLAEQKKQLVYALANTGKLQSSSTSDRFGLLEKQYNLQNQNINDQAEQYSQDIQNKVNAAKTSAQSNLQATGDPNLAASQSLSTANTLMKPPSLSPLANVLQSASQGLQTYLGAKARADSGTAQSGYYFAGNGNKSSEVIR